MSAWSAAEVATPARWALQEQWRREGWLDRPDLGAVLLERAARGGRSLVRIAEGTPRVQRGTARIAREGVAIASGLRRAGLRRGDRVLVQLPDPVDRWSATVALAVLGAVAVPVPSASGAAEVGRIAEDSGAVGLIVGTEWRGRPLSGHALIGSRAAEHLVVAGGGGPDGVLRWEDLVGLDPDPIPEFGVASPDDAFVILYTSGSTGVPKGVVHTHGGFVAEMLTGHDNAGAGPYGGVQLSPYPGGHLSALTGDLRGMLHNRTTVVLGDWEARLHGAAILDEDVTTTNGTPFFLTRFLEQLRERGIADAGGLSFRSGAASVSPGLVAEADALGVLAFRCYGSSEHPTVTNGGPYLPLRRRASTDGTPLPGARIRVVGEDGTTRERGEAGALETSGPDQFVGYTDPAATAAAFTADGWYRTGDLATIDDEGVLTVLGRADDTINRGGAKFAPAAIEAVLRLHPRIVDAVVLGRADDAYGERVHAFIALRDGGTIGLDELRAHFDRHGADRHGTPESVTVLDRIPTTEGGKPDRKRLRAALNRPAER